MAGLIDKVKFFLTNSRSPKADSGSPTKFSSPVEHPILQESLGQTY